MALTTVPQSMLTLPLTAGTAVASTSGTSIDFTGIPTGVKRVTVMFNGVSTSGASHVQVQLGSGTIQTTSYAWSGAYVYSTAGGAVATTGFDVDVATAGSAAYIRSGIMTLTTLGSNVWASSYAGGINASGTGLFMGGGGNVTLSGTLDRVRITTVNGTDTFDAGSVNILWE